MPPLNIIAVEDEPAIAELLIYLLEGEGYHVRHASNGLIALEMLSAARADLIITDFMMPVMTGPELIEAVQANPRLRKIPILVVTALSQQYVDSKCPAVHSFMQKPFPIQWLVARVGALLAKPLGLAAKRGDEHKALHGEV